MIKKTKTIPIYGGKWIIGFYSKDEIKKVSDMYNLRQLSEYTAVCFEEKEKYYTLFQIDKITPGIIAHEAKHLVNAIYINHNIELDRHNDEPEAYLLTWLVNRIHENLK